MKWVFLFVCRRADRVHCVSNVMGGALEELGIQKKKLFVFPMGVDENFLQVGWNREKRLKEEGVTVISNRNHLPIYNVSFLIRSIPTVLKAEPKTQFLIAGDGPQRESLEKEAAALNLNCSVRFVGRVSHAEMPDLLARAEIYVSTALYDGTSVSLLEAMAAGLFPIVTEIPANLEWIDHGRNGFLVPVNDPVSLAGRIIDAVRMKVSPDQSRCENLALVRAKALWPVMVQRLNDIYEGLLQPEFQRGGINIAST